MPGWRRAPVGSRTAWCTPGRASIGPERDDTRRASVVVPALALAACLDHLGESDDALRQPQGRAAQLLLPRWGPPLLQFFAAVALYRRGNWDDALAEVDAGLRAADDIDVNMAAFWPYAVAALVTCARVRSARLGRCCTRVHRAARRRRSGGSGWPARGCVWRRPTATSAARRASWSLPSAASRPSGRLVRSSTVGLTWPVSASRRAGPTWPNGSPPASPRPQDTVADRRRTAQLDRGADQRRWSRSSKQQRRACWRRAGCPRQHEPVAMRRWCWRGRAIWRAHADSPRRRSPRSSPRRRAVAPPAALGSARGRPGHPAPPRPTTTTGRVVEPDGVRADDRCAGRRRSDEHRDRGAALRLAAHRRVPPRPGVEARPVEPLPSSSPGPRPPPRLTPLHPSSLTSSEC